MAPFAALLATFAGHAAIGFLVWAGGPARVTPKQQPNDNVLSVRLTKTDATIERTLLPKAMSVPVNKQERTTDDSLVPIVQPVGPYYFRLSELTEKPVVVDDLVSTLVVRLAGLDPQPVVLRLLVSDEGRVDRVIVEESHLTEDVERELRETFARLRFEPGRIGRIAVRSQMRVEVRIETMERRLPG